MKLGLYSITYLGVWYRGSALTLEQFIARAREFGYDGIEIDGKRPHGNPLDLSPARRLELRRQAEAAGLEIYAVAANNDFSSPIPEYREAQLAYVRELIALTADLGAPILRMFAGWPGVTFAPSTETAAAGSPSKHSGVGTIRRRAANLGGHAGGRGARADLGSLSGGSGRSGALGCRPRCPARTAESSAGGRQRCRHAADGPRSRIAGAQSLLRRAARADARGRRHAVGAPGRRPPAGPLAFRRRVRSRRQRSGPQLRARARWVARRPRLFMPTSSRG